MFFRVKFLFPTWYKMDDIVWGNEDVINMGKTVKESNLYRSYNEIWFSCSVTNESINTLIKLMYEVLHDEKLSAYRESSKEIEIVLHIDSPGGSVNSLFKFVDFVKLLKKKNIKLRTIINGRAASAATLMAIVGDVREITPHSHTMIHELSAVNHGYYTHMKSYSKHLDHCHAQIIDIYKKHIVDNKADIENLLLKETWLSAEEYLELGFVDKICV